MNVDRLNHLITVLEQAQLKEHRFYMGYWADVDPEKPTICGTAACALGTAAFDPVCIDDGLAMQATYRDDLGDRHEWLLTDKAAWDRAFAAIPDYDVEFVPEYDGQTGFEAGAIYYGINMEQANYLFDPGRYSRNTANITPQDVIVHVQEVLAGHLDDAGLEPDDMDEREPPDDPDDSQARPTEGFV